MKLSKRSWQWDGKRREAWGWSSVDDTGKQVRRSGFESKSKAQDDYDAWVREGKKTRGHREPIPETPPAMTLGEAAERYLKVKARKKSIDEDRRILEVLKAEFGEATPLPSITANRISDYKAKRLAAQHNGRDLTPAAINRPLALLRHLLRIAHEEWEAIDKRPRVKLEKEGQHRLRWATTEEAKRLLDACRGSRNKDLFDLVELALFTGLRQGEVLELQWDRVDRARGVIQLEVTKGGRRREAPLNSRADGVLERRAKAGTEGYVFRSQDWNGYQTAWLRAVKRAQLADFRFHDLRHTFASWAVQNGASLQEVKDLLGHRTLAMVLRYAHLAPEHLRAAAGRLDAVLDAPTRIAQEVAQEVNGIEVVRSK